MTWTWTDDDDGVFDPAMVEQTLDWNGTTEDLLSNGDFDLWLHTSKTGDGDEDRMYLYRTLDSEYVPLSLSHT